MNFFTALRFLTIFPAPAAKDGAELPVGRALPYFPAVGLLVGVILAALYWALRLVFPQIIVAALLVAYLAVITGAHHLDGLIDTCDALVAGRTKEQRLAIMSDTRVGAFGITGVCILLLTKFAALSGTTSLAVLAITPALSRWALGGVILSFPAAKNQGMGADTKSSTNLAGFAWSTALCLAIAIIFAGLIDGPLLMLALFALVCCLALLLNRLFGGLTGDCYGAMIEIGEALTLLLAVALLPLTQQLPGHGLLRLTLPS